ncbi:hypothetical protein C3747_11g417 [Trypanosoma cruzi]|uniref:Transmembrane protein n=2 Tax=Trypanosoma cruzi TaxID=5693 RepID=Q4DV46_TRYCC|nr:hypothetical protein, conserved [Trypanosoma cruzi]EAN96410.1 hypothetical protein, conserved [Trypanosoma cruzi]PWV19113.1 hypothetical protein C3747_11g417 [Trypanosoma cruzi]|eukprot:XP_818261.1 hypothetical protein [Trypanosoma cruzi strain CL Brener]
MDRSSWLSVSIIFLIILAVLLLLYFVVGIIVRYHKGMRHCPEVLPNYRCWCGLFHGLVVLLTCGRYAPRFAYCLNNYRYGNSGGDMHESALPSRPRQARHLAFEALQSDDEEDESSWEINVAMQPSDAVTVYPTV